jgi:hypothetical protein
MFDKIGEATAVSSDSSEGPPPRATKQRSKKRADPTESRRDEEMEEKWSYARSHRDEVESDSENEQEVETEPALTQSEDDETDQ